MGQLKVQSGTHEGNCHSEDWKLLEGEGARENTYKVTFESAFTELPAVQVAPIGMEVFNTDNTRYSINVDEVTKSDFTLRFKTWGKTKIWYIKINWMAVGQ